MAWYQADKARIDAVDHWLVAEVAGLDRTGGGLVLTESFRDACRAQVEGLGAVGFSATYYVGELPEGAAPATVLCHAAGSPGWNRNGVAAQVSEARQDGRHLGWGEYFDEDHDEFRPGFQVYWRFHDGDVLADVDLMMPRP